MSPKWPRHFRFSSPEFVHVFIVSTMHATGLYSAHLILLDLITLSMDLFGEAFET
jgi:hypothetical protein